MIQLRDYQVDAINGVRQSFVDGHKAVVLVMPTGAGKTSVFAELARLMNARQKRVWFCAHLFELCEQARARAEAFGVSVGTIAPGWHEHLGRLTQVAMVQSLGRRLAKIPQQYWPDFLIVDEGHHATSGTYRTIADSLESAPRPVRTLALTATPFRLDGKGMGTAGYTEIIAPVTAAQLVERGFLVPARYYATTVDLEGLKMRAGEFANDELYKKFNKKPLYQGVVTNYENYAEGRPTICFNINVEHSLKTCQAFTERGISAVHVDGGMSKQARDDAFNGLRSGKYSVLCNVGLACEGVDIPHVSCVIMNRATASRSLWLQCVGRGLRPAAGKSECIVLDHGGNVRQFGFFDDEIEYTLEDRQKKKTTVGVVPMKSCANCASMIHAGLRVCSWCGYQYPDERGKATEAVFVEVSRQFLPPTVAKRKQFKAVPPDLEATSPYDWSAVDWERVRVLCGYKRGWEKHQTAWQRMHGAGQEGGMAA